MTRQQQFEKLMDRLEDSREEPSEVEWALVRFCMKHRHRITVRSGA